MLYFYDIKVCGSLLVNFSTQKNMYVFKSFYQMVYNIQHMLKHSMFNKYI